MSKVRTKRYYYAFHAERGELWRFKERQDMLAFV